MGNDVNEFFNQVPEGWGLVPLNPGAPEEPPKPEAPDHRTLVGRFPGTEIQQRPSDARGKSRLMIDARIDAKRRRHVKDVVQLAWDRETNAAYMLKAACGDNGLAGIIPLARVMEQLKITLAGRCGGFERVSQQMSSRALHTAARCFMKGDIEWTIKLMAPIQSLVVRKPGPEAMQEVLATFIRDLFPSAPQTYIPPQNRVGNKVAVGERVMKLDDKKAQAARKVQIQQPPNLEAVAKMQPARARILLPAMRQAYEIAPSEQKEQFAKAIEIMRKIVEDDDANRR